MRGLYYVKATDFAIDETDPNRREWINLFFDGEIIDLVTDIKLIRKIKTQIPEFVPKPKTKKSLQNNEFKRNHNTLCRYCKNDNTKSGDPYRCLVCTTFNNNGFINYTEFKPLKDEK